MRLKRLGVWSVAKIGALFGIIYGFIAGIFFSIALATGNLAAATAMPTASLEGFGYLSIIIFPIIYGIVYLVMGALTSWIYNLLANWIGGIEVDLGEGITKETKTVKPKRK